VYNLDIPIKQKQLVNLLHECILLWDSVFMLSTCCATYYSASLINEWARFDQSIADAAISQWRRHLSACVCVGGAH